jgi:hypothetical protein
MSSEYNEHGVLKNCVRCKKENTQNEEDDIYCIHCAAPLLNKCTNEGDINNPGCESKMPSDASFCSKCASRTTFYVAGLVETEYPETQLVASDLEDMF